MTLNTAAPPQRQETAPSRLEASLPRGEAPRSTARVETAGPSAELVRRAAAGERAAFDQLVLRYQDDAVNTAYYYLGHYEDAVDAAQEAFLKAYRSLPAFRGSSTFRTWILTIVLNTARSLRARSRAKKRSARLIRIDGACPEAETSERPCLDVPDSSANPAKLLERKEVKEALERAIAELEDESREVVVLRDISGESYEAIAEALDIPLGTVKSRVHRARLELQKKMARFL